MFKNTAGPLIFGAIVAIFIFIPEWLVGTIGYDMSDPMMLRSIAIQILAIALILAIIDPSLFNGYTYLICPGAAFLIIGMQTENREAVVTIALTILISWVAMLGIYKLRKFLDRPRPLSRPWDARR